MHIEGIKIVRLPPNAIDGTMIESAVAYRLAA
jgi:hypothetical protein